MPSQAPVLQAGEQASVHVLPAVHGDIAAGHERRRIAADERHQRGDFIRFPQPSQRNLRQDLFLQDVFGHGLDHRRGQVARRHGIDRDVLLGQFQRQGLGEPMDAGLGCRVVGLPERCLLYTSDAADE